MLSNAQQCSVMLSNAQQSSVKLSNTQRCSAMLKNAKKCSVEWGKSKQKLKRRGKKSPIFLRHFLVIFTYCDAVALFLRTQPLYLSSYSKAVEFLGVTKQGN